MKVTIKVIAKTRNDGAVISEVGCTDQASADRQSNQLRMLYGDRNIEIETVPVKVGGKREATK